MSAARGLTTPAASSPTTPAPALHHPVWTHNMSRRAGYGAEQSTPQLANTILYINKYTHEQESDGFPGYVVDHRSGVPFLHPQLHT